MLTFVKVNADNTLASGLIDNLFPYIILIAILGIDRVTERSSSALPQIFPCGLARQKTMNDPCGSAVGHKFRCLIESQNQMFQLSGLANPGSARDQQPVCFESFS